MPRERIKDQVERLIGSAGQPHRDLQMSQICDEFSCEKHQWLGLRHLGHCPTCRREAEEAKHVKKLRAWERYRDLADFMKIALEVNMSRGVYAQLTAQGEAADLICGPPEECAKSAMRYAKAALELLEAELPKET